MQPFSNEPEHEESPTGMPVAPAATEVSLLVYKHSSSQTDIFSSKSYMMVMHNGVIIQTSLQVFAHPEGPVHEENLYPRLHEVAFRTVRKRPASNLHPASEDVPARRLTGKQPRHK